MDQGYIVTTTVQIGLVPKAKKIKTWHSTIERARYSIQFAKKLRLYKNSVFKISRPGEGVVETI
jgi:hypothetical protein